MIDNSISRLPAGGPGRSNVGGMTPKIRRRIDQPISLAPLAVPNTDISPPDVAKGTTPQVAAVAVAGTIAIDPATGRATSDYHAIAGCKGDVVTSPGRR